MQKRTRWNVGLLMVGLVMVTGLLTACSQTSARTTSEKSQPARVEQIEGTDFSRVSLSAKAAERLDIQSAPVREAEVARKGSAGGAMLRKVIPYAAVLYDVNGHAFVYTNPEPLTFVRAPISVDYIEGDLAVLLDGPPSGSAVVTVGAAELYGTEFEFKE